MECCIILPVPIIAIIAFFATLFPAKGESRTGILHVQSKGWGCALGFLAGVFGLLAFMFRADNNEELAHGRKVDLVAGGLFAAAFLLSRLADPPPRRRSWKYVTALGTILVWVVTSGPLLLWHEAVAKVRFNNPRLTNTMRVRDVYIALSNYLDDCGAYPPDELGLRALNENPGVEGWRGPYLDPPIVTDWWGNPIRYAERDGQLVVWSCGKDGISNTEDDYVFARE